MREPTIAWWPGVIKPGQVGGALGFTEHHMVARRHHTRTGGVVHWALLEYTEHHMVAKHDYTRTSGVVH